MLCCVRVPQGRTWGRKSKHRRSFPLPFTPLDQSSAHPTMTTQPAVQSAWVMSRRGTPTAALQLVSNHPVPTPSGSQLLVKLHAAALNPVGWKLMGMPFVHKVPAVPESDFSGVVVAGGDGTDWKVGDEVFGITPVRAFPLTLYLI